MKRIMMLIIFVLTVFGFVFYFTIYPTIKNEDTIVIPDIVGMSEDDGLLILDEQKINYEVVYQNGEKNDVIKTVPAVNSLIKENQKIIVYISVKEQKRVDDLTGYSYEDAISILEGYKEEYGITYNIKYQRGLSGLNNVVIFQSDTTSYLDEINNLDVTISLVESTVLMPNFVGCHYNEALSFCKANGFVIDTIFTSSILERYTIIYQETKEGEELYKNSGKHLLFYVAK